MLRNVLLSLPRNNLQVNSIRNVQKKYPKVDKKLQAAAESLASRGFLRPSKPWDPPASIENTITQICADNGLKSDSEIETLDVKFAVLKACYEETGHSVPNSLMHTIETVDDLKSFYMTPVDTKTPFDALTKMELPKNLHVQENYVRFHPDKDTLFNGATAYPKSSTIVSGLKTRKKYEGFSAKRLLPTVLAWLFMRKFNIKLKIGRIAVPKLILKDVTLSKDRYFILVSVVIRGVQVNNNVAEKRSVVVETILKPLLSKQNSLSKEGMAETATATVHIFDASITLYNKSLEPYTIYATATEVHADGAAGGPARALVFSTKVVEGRAMIVGGGERLGEAEYELYHFAQKHKKLKKHVQSCSDVEGQFASIIPRMSPVIPKIFSLRIDGTKVGCSSKSTNTNFEMSLQSLQVNSRFSAASVHLDDAGCEVASLPQVYVAFQMDHTLNVTYTHKNVVHWYLYTMEKMRTSRPLQIRDSSGCAELRSVCVQAALKGGRTMVAGCGGVKVKLDQLLDTRELLVDGGWCAVGQGTGQAARLREPPPRRHHAWGSALLAVALVKWGSHGPRDSKVEAMMDCLRLEWSTVIAETIISLYDCIQDYGPSTPSVPPPALPESPCNITVNVALSHINLFLIVSEDVCLMTRIDAITLEKTVVKSGAVISGLKVVDTVPYRDEITSSFLHVKLARIEQVLSRERPSTLLDFQLLETVDFEWSANLHLKILTFVRAIKRFGGELKQRGTERNEDEVVRGKGRAIDWRVSFKRDTNLLLLLKLTLVLNGAEIVTVEGYSQERAADDAELRVERKANEGFQLMSVNVNSIRVIFPYKHRFADAVQGDFVSLFKWIKLIEEILIEMSDDPFEVKLRDNYELLEDEYKESERRRTMLDAKVQELCKPHLFLPAGKVDELYAALRAKDAQIYVQRCRAAPPPRTRLVACCLSGLKIIALADPSIHGTANAVDELYAALRAKDAQIYVKRCRAAPPPRTRLVACCLSGLKIIALADPRANSDDRPRSTLGRGGIRTEHDDSQMFNGDPLEWLAYKLAYDESTKICKYSDAENMWRLRKSLKGEAKETVCSLLIGNTAPHIIIEALELRYGRPETIIHKITYQLKKIPPLSQNYHHEIVSFSIKIKNYVAAVKAVNQTDYLRSPELVSNVLTKCPSALINKWADYYGANCNIQKAKLEMLAEFLYNEANKISAAGLTHLHIQSDYRKKPEERRPHSVLLGAKRDVTRCQFCKISNHKLPECARFKRALTKDRWRFVRVNNLCHKCLLATHSHDNCSAASCPVDECGLPHHRLLHWKSKTSANSEKSESENKTNSDDNKVLLTSDKTVDQVNNDCPVSNETVANAVDSSKSCVFLKVVPVNIHGPKGVFRTHALMDDGATVSLIAADIANRVGLHGQKQTLRVRGAWDSELKCDSEQINCKITSINNDSFDISMRKISELNLPLQKISNINLKDYEHFLGVHNKPRKNKDECKAIEMVEKSAKLINGKWEVGLPWKDENAKMASSFCNAYRRLKTIERKMSTDQGFALRYKERVSRPSLDPSAPLSWWDKVRLMMHGRVTARCSRFTCLLHVSLDPYNTTEEMELSWSELVLDWTNGKLCFLGSLEVLVRTASKYDDCRVARVPALKLSAKLGWTCVADARDHRSVAPCAPTRLPEYSSNQGTSGPGALGGGMLAALVAEAGGEAPVVFSDELSGAEADAQPTHQPNIRHVLDDDNSHTACLIELVNSQVVLKGCETRGYVVLCAARAEVRQRVRRTPPATAWSGALSAMQYYATVSAADRDQLPENIQWVPVEEISGGGSAEISTLPDVPRLVGSGHSAGGVIGSTVGPSQDSSLAQISTLPDVPRLVGSGHLAGGVIGSTVGPSQDSSLAQEAGAGAGAAHGWGDAHPPYDSFALMHHDLDVCTNSLQYAMLLDVINNVVLHVEPERRRTLERRARMRFQLQLRHDQDPRHLIHKLQTQVNECKESVWSLGEELDAMVRGWREERRGARRTGTGPAPLPAPPHRYNEICFKSARWRLTDADGQLGIADLLLTNFLYTKTSRSDDSVEHQLEVGYVQVLAPAAPMGRAPVARRATLRVFCRDRPPVGGIAVKEHFEVNIRDPDSMEEGDEEGEGTLRGGASGLVATGSKKVKKKGKDSNSNFYERAEKNKLFIYIKIPEVPVRVSYKGSKEKNLEDVRDLPLVLPTLEYHNGDLHCNVIYFFLINIEQDPSKDKIVYLNLAKTIE
ncbi:Uncharacterized protein OBRU01_01431 [Operophtera brumata]|uniref:Large ribosomal subunit protein mL50 n=1 Tax=Operophtera brumata TaxID=104452 RepID=A0A0L7LU49_OPEBR|nr:Uncharacterized protein OBRU01_01431 [Operophtera brumata]